MTTEPYRYVLTVDGREIELSDGEVTIGRSRTCTVRIDHESVSRSHALLTLEKGAGVVKDLNSSNGTYVGGRRVLNETKLSDGDRIQLGAAVIAYRVAWTTKSERTALIDAESEAAAPPPPQPPQSAVAASAPAPLSPHTDGGEGGDTEKPAPVLPPPPPAPPAGAADEASGPVPPPLLEISAPHLARKERQEEPRGSVAAASALEAVRSVGEPPPPPEPPRPLIRIPAPPRPAPPPAARPSLASVPLRGAASHATGAAHPAPALPGAEEPAGFGARLLAQLVDGVVLTAVNIVLLSPVLLIMYFRGEIQTREAGLDTGFVVVLVLCGVLMIAANLWYVVGGWAKNGRTPGKSLLNIAVVLPGVPAGSGIGWKAAFLRALGTVVSTLLFGVGYLVALVRRDRRALHDLIAGTRVVRVS